MRQPLEYHRTTSLATIAVNCMVSLLTLLVIYAIASNQLKHPLYLAAILASFAVTLLTYAIVCQRRNAARSQGKLNRRRNQSM